MHLHENVDHIKYFNYDGEASTNACGVDGTAAIEVKGNLVPENVLIVQKLIGFATFWFHLKL